MDKKKWLALLVAAAMLCAMLPMTVLAAGASADVGTKDEFLAALEDASVTAINITADIDLTDIPAQAANVLDLSGRTVDLGGNTIKVNNFALIYEGTDFTIKNGTFDGNGGDYALFIGDGPTSNVVIQDVTTIGGINIYNSTNVVLRDVDVTGIKYYAIWCDEGGQVTVESGTFRTNGKAVLGMAQGDVDSALAIEGGDFQTNGKPLVLEDGQDRQPPVVSGGTFDCSAIDYVADELKFERNDSGTFTYYKTLEAALEGAGTDTVITAVEETVAAFTATLECNDGTGRIIKMTAGADGKLTLPAISHSGYVFLGWDNGDGKPIAADTVYTLTGDATFAGMWKAFTKVKTEAKAATCTADGNTAYWYCPELDKYFSDEALTKEIQLADTVVAAAGHGNTALKNAKDATCTADGYTGDKVCSVCGEITQKGTVIAKTAHTFANGKCTVCGAADPSVKPVEPTPTPDKPETDNPETGEKSSLLFWILLAGVAAAGATALAVYRKKVNAK